MLPAIRPALPSRTRAQTIDDAPAMGRVPRPCIGLPSVARDVVNNVRAAAGSTASPSKVDAVAELRSKDPHAVLGPHPVTLLGGRRATAVRAFLPGFEGKLTCKTADGATHEMRSIHPSGIFECVLPQTGGVSYVFETEGLDGVKQAFEDSYRFTNTTSAMQRWLFREGTLDDVAGFLGAHRCTIDGVEGYRFCVWAPNAERMSVVGEHNDWDGRRHMMRKADDGGTWECFVPGAEVGGRYGFEVAAKDGTVTVKADPCGRAHEVRPKRTSILTDSSAFSWGDDDWMAARAQRDLRKAPVSTYEVHLGSWQRGPDGEHLSYREIADRLVPYLKENHFNHVELMPITEHPFDGSWGYQVTGYYAPTSRFGSPDDFKYLVDKCHDAGIGVVLDWVPGHFPKDPHGLARFDGTSQFDHQDDRLGAHKEWGTRIFNYDRPEVSCFLAGSILHLMDEFHLDGVRVDGVASMLYRDYARNDGEWIPNADGGNEAWDAVKFLRKVNTKIGAKFPGAMRIAEESTSWPHVTGDAVDDKSLGFDLKWNMGWMNDTLRWFSLPPEQRKASMDGLTNTLLWRDKEAFVCALSHDEVVHGKRSLVEKMPGDEEAKQANLRLLLGYMWAYPGHKLLFMGGELGQRAEWNEDKQLDWPSARNEGVGSTAKLVADLNRLYISEPALAANQYTSDDLELVARDTDAGAIALLRKAPDRADDVLFAFNVTDAALPTYRIGVDAPGQYAPILDTDAVEYGGKGRGPQAVPSEAIPANGKPHSIAVTLPPFSTVALKRS